MNNSGINSTIHNHLLMPKSISSKNSLGYCIRNAIEENIDNSQLCQNTFVLDSQTKENKKCHSRAKAQKCEFCQQIFKRAYDLQKHTRIHDIIGEKSNLCLVCEKTFAYSSSLKTHARTHNVEKLFQCEVCKQIFSVLAI